VRLDEQRCGGTMSEEQRLRLVCHCGWNTEGTKADVVKETQDHVTKVHWVEADEEDILEMATVI
jgi:predicted small metal-binding protein